VRTLRGQRPHAIIIAGSRTDEPATRTALVRELTAYRRAGGRVALVSQPDLPFPTISVDNAGGAGDLARALAGLGYRRFAVLHGPRGLRTSRDRVDGFLTALRHHDPAIRPAVLVETEFTRDGGYHGARRIARQHRDEVDLIFAVNDVMAIGAMAALRDAGLTPGADIAVAGFDDITPALDVTPTLTTVAVPLAELGARAMALALTSPETRPVRTAGTTVELRASTPPRAVSPFVRP
jgi:LacI family transcriptional regulator